MIRLYNGVELPDIGFGTFPQKEELRESVPTAIRAGYQLVDTSDNYLNEAFVGDGLSSVSETPVVVVTKFSQPLRTFDLSKCFEESRQRLGGRIDVYLLHWPFPYLWKDAWKRMEDLYLSGQCKAIGVCNFEKPMLQKLMRFCRVKPMIDQFERHPLFCQRETADFCRDNGIVVMSYSPLARMDQELFSNSVLKSISEQKHKTVSQIILRWNIEHGDIPIPASRRAEHILANFGVFDFRLSKEEVLRIDALDAGHRIRFDPKTRFDQNMKRRFLRYKIKIATIKITRALGMYKFVRKFWRRGRVRGTGSSIFY